MSSGFLEKRVKGDNKQKIIRRGLEKKADPNLHRFFESLKGQIRSSSKEAGVYVPRANILNFLKILMSTLFLLLCIKTQWLIQLY